MSNADVSDELLKIANLAYFQCRGNDVEKLRAALNAIAPRLRADGMREAAEAKPTIAFQKERYGATVATIADDGAGSVLEVMKLPNDRFQLTVHSYNEQRGYGEDMSITLKAEHFVMLGQIPAAARADALDPPKETK